MATQSAPHYEADAMRAFAQRVGGSSRRGWVLYAVSGVLLGLYLALNQVINLEGNAHFAAWKPLVWEMSSALVIFATIPLVVRFENRRMMALAIGAPASTTTVTVQSTLNIA